LRPRGDHLMKDAIDFVRSIAHAMIHPPNQKGNEAAGEHMRAAFQFPSAGRVAGTWHREFFFDSACETPTCQFPDIIQLARCAQSQDKPLHLSQMGAKLADRKNTARPIFPPRQQTGNHFKKVLDVAHEQIVLAAVVRVKSGAAHLGAIEHILHRDLGPGLFLHKNNQGIAEHIPSPGYAAIDLPCGFGGFSGHRRFVCSKFDVSYDLRSRTSLSSHGGKTKMKLTDRESGFALIAGSVGILVTLSFHPSGHGMFDPATYETVTRRLVEVHSIALFSLPLWFLGALGLSRRLDSAGDGAIFPLTAFVFGIAAMLTGVVFDGLVTPGLARQLVNAAPEARQGWRTAFIANQVATLSFVHVFEMALPLAMVLWSVMIARTGALPRGLGYYGILIGGAAIVALVSGRLDREHHAFLASILLQVTWLIAVGIPLCYTPRASIIP